MFKGKKVKLRAYKEEDTEKVLEILESDGIRETLSKIPIFPLSLNQEIEFIKAAMSCDTELFKFAIEGLENGEYLGGCGINSIDRKNSVATIGVWLGKKYHGKGYASDALRILCKHIFDELNINKIKLDYYEFNLSGKRCYEKLGFMEEGRLRKEIFRYGKYHDVITMGLFREELK